jgi:6,7-dimethyl-8-ribityllumazine synthase
MTRLGSPQDAAKANLKLGNKKIAVVVSRFNAEITEALLAGALDCLRRHGIVEKKIDVFHVPGSLEIPTLAAKLAGRKKYAAIVALGAVLRGETHHFEIVARNSTAPLIGLSMKHKIPITCGILTVDSTEQARERAGGKEGNKGWDAALAALEMVRVMEKL